MSSPWIDWLSHPTVQELLSVQPLSWKELFACVLSATIIGSERQKHNKPIGVRTSILICVATYTMVAAGLSITTDGSDPTRIVGQVVTGIGFLGAGVMLTRDGAVVGLTSAASVWMLAAIGVVIAIDSPMLGIKLSIIAFLVLISQEHMAPAFGRLGRRLIKRRDSSPDRTPDIEPLDKTLPAVEKQPELEKHEHE